MSEGDDARRGLFGNMTSGGEGDESARSGLRVRGCRHSTTGRPAQLPSRRFPPRISFPPPPPPLFARRARALYLSPSFPPSPLLSYSALSPSFRPSRVESSRVEPLLPFLGGSPLTPLLLLSLLVAIVESPAKIFDFPRDTFSSPSSPPPFSRGRRENRVERFLPSFLSSLLHRIENIDTIISERYVYSYIRV